MSYVIPKLRELFDKAAAEVSTVANKRLWAKRTALLENLNTYYWYAVSCVEKVEKADQAIIDAIGTGEFATETLENDLHSSAIAFYGFARVVIESARILKEDGVLNATKEEVSKGLIDLGREYGSWARNVIKARNDITAHPHQIRQFIIGIPSSWGSGNVSFRAFDLEELSFQDVFDLAPGTDLGKLKEYLEQLVSLLEEAWFSSEH